MSTSKYHVTASGFLKYEVYQSFIKALLDKNATQVCYLLAELACTRGEVNHLYDALIDAHCTFYLTRNTWVLGYVVEKVGALRALPKKNLAQHPVFQKRLCEWAVVLSMQRAKQVEAFAPTSSPQGASGGGSTGVDMAVLAARSGDSDHSSVSVPAASALLTRDFKPRVSGDVFLALMVMERGLGRRRFSDVQASVRFLLAAPAHLVDAFTFDEIGHVKPPLRKDPVWFAWRLLLQQCVGASALVGTVVRNALCLYAFQFKKKVRIRRAPLLLYACWVACHPEEVRCKPLQDLVVNLEAASQNVRVVFAEIQEAAALAAAANTQSSADGPMDPEDEEDDYNNNEDSGETDQVGVDPPEQSAEGRQERKKGKSRDCSKPSSKHKHHAKSSKTPSSTSLKQQHADAEAEAIRQRMQYLMVCTYGGEGAS